MTVKDLVCRWEDQSYGNLSKEAYSLNLSQEDAAKIDALVEMYPRHTKDQLIGDLISAALQELESCFPYVQGKKVISTDEMGDPIYEDIGPTPAFLALTRKHLGKHRSAKNN